MKMSPSVSYDPEKFGEGNQPELGKYHGVIVDANEPDKGGTVKVKIQVLAGTVPGQEGKAMNDAYFPFNENAADRLKHLLFITNTATLAQINSDEDIPLKMLIGKQLLFEVVQQKERPGIDKKTGLPTVFPARKAVGYRPEAVDCKNGDWAKVPRDERALGGDFGFQDAPVDGQHSGNENPNGAAETSTGSAGKEDSEETGFNFG